MKFEITSFNGTRHFASWRKKIKAFFIQHKLQKALVNLITLPSMIMDMEKENMQNFAYLIIVLCLADNMLHQIDGIDTTYEAWNKLEELYMT